MTDYEKDFYKAVAANLGLEINSIPDSPANYINKLWQIFICGTHSAAKDIALNEFQQMKRCMPEIKKSAEKQASLA